MAHIQVIQHEEAVGELKEIYDHLVKTRGKLAEIHKIQSLHPKSIINHMDLYMTIMFGKSPLRRFQREMIATVVSVANKCLYCINHHGEALNHFWKDSNRINKLVTNFKDAGLSILELALCRYAEDLTKNPETVDKNDHMTDLKAAGLSDRALLDATLVIAYFNFVNRIVMGLGVDLEAEGGTGYDYD